MGGVKAVTRKMISFHGFDEEFTNVYYFGNGSLAGISGTDAEGLINALITSERTIFSTNVRFLGGTTYPLNAFHKPMSEPNASVELAAGITGNVSPTTGLYRECAIDVRLILTGRRILRSLLHTNASHGIPIDGATTGSIGAALTAWAVEMRDANFRGTGLRRISPSGQTPTGYQINPYMEHRQFHRYRRR